MLLDPRDWSLAFRSHNVIADLPPDLRERVTPETHAVVRRRHRLTPQSSPERSRDTRQREGQGDRDKLVGNRSPGDNDAATAVEAVRRRSQKERRHVRA
jgi:hypothetical protein